MAKTKEQKKQEIKDYKTNKKLFFLVGLALGKAFVSKLFVLVGIRSAEIKLH